MRLLVAIFVLIGGAGFVAAQTVPPPAQFPIRTSQTYDNFSQNYAEVPELQVGGGQTTLSIPGWSIVL